MTADLTEKRAFCWALGTMEQQLVRPTEPFVFGTHPSSASLGIIRDISAVLQSSAAFGRGIDSTEIVNASVTSSTETPEDHHQEFACLSSEHQSSQDCNSKANNNGSLEYSSRNRYSEMNGPVGDAVEPEQDDSSCVKRSSKTGVEQIAYEPKTKENNSDMNEDGTGSLKEGREPVSPAPLLTRLDRLDIVLAYLEEKSLFSGHSTPAPNTNGESDKLSLEKRCKPISSVLVETKAKGNIVERVASLENKVSRLSEDLCRMITSARSSSNIAVGETNVNMKGSNRATHGFDLFEEEKHQVLPDEECVRKDVHENISLPTPLFHGITKPGFSPCGEKENENVLADRKNNNENVTKYVFPFIHPQI